MNLPRPTKAILICMAGLLAATAARVQSLPDVSDISVRFQPSQSIFDPNDGNLYFGQQQSSYLLFSLYSLPAGTNSAALRKAILRLYFTQRDCLYEGFKIYPILPSG